MEFSEWMRSVELTEASVNNYVGAIKGRLSNWAHAHGITSRPITAISDPVEFAIISGKLRQTPEYITWNDTGHGMYGAALNNYHKYLVAVGSATTRPAPEIGPYQKQVDQIQSETGESFNPNGQDDARDRVLREVVRRRGQRKFRQALIDAYGGCCALTGCPVVPLLEAAHVTPYLGPETNSVTNGLLLRADLHTLWDLGLIAVHPDTNSVWVSPDVNDPAYQSLSGLPLRPPVHNAQRPSAAALEYQWKLVQSM